jgi:flagellar basal-body rod protein FlgF
VGYGLYSTDQQPQPSPSASFIQGAVEASNVEPIAELIRLSEVSRLYEQAQKALEMDDERQSQVINVAA